MRLIILFLFGILVISCKKENELPLPTAEGRNTFGYLNNMGYEVGGGINENDTIFRPNDSTFHFTFASENSVHMWSNMRWEILYLETSYITNGANHEFSLQRVQYQRVLTDINDTIPDFESDMAAKYVMDTSLSEEIELSTWHDEGKFLAAVFSVPMVLLRTENDSTWLDYSQTFTLAKGRFDIEY